ncbi:hypothetical protein BX666DRAFT_1991927 [Dichotomocladium elegans]|nr:hypothetical protein BX666DRAFT_1991927 [Dichotomocladium elegans]
MSITLQPGNALSFRPLDSSSRMSFSTLTVRNEYNNPVAFRIQSTAPFRYIVKPRAGVVFGKSTIQIEILMLPPSPESANDAEFSDTFLLETSEIVQQRHLASLANDLWTRIDANPQYKIERHRVICHFDTDMTKPLIDQELERTKSELLSLEGRLDLYDDELDAIRDLRDQQRKTTVSLQVLLAVAVTVFSLSYAFFTHIEKR